MNLIISDNVRQKLAVKHGGISEEDIIECFSNRDGKFLRDTRSEHQTNPPSLWFIAETNNRRKLKVVFIYFADSNQFTIKTAYSANPDEIKIYNKYA